jgi:UDP-N-acetylmuramoylalanine--D-glutamate ligase
MKKAMVYGAGVSGKSVIKLLEKIGWETLLVDDKVGMNSKEAETYLSEIDLFIKSPGIPYNKLVKKVKELDIKILDEIEVAFNYLKQTSKTKIIAVSGTNGKTTTVSKIAELLNKVGKKSVAAGNIGEPFSKVVLDDNIYEYIVLELSSYQLENLEFFKPDIAFIINLAPDHLDRYEDVDDYYDSKFNMTKNIEKSDIYLLNTDDSEIMKRKGKINSEILEISLNQNADVCVVKDTLYYKGKKVTKIDDFSLKGIHNLQNILFIVGVAKLIGISDENIIEFLKNTKNLEHRMEEFYSHKNIKFINDSKGTNIESTIKAMGAFANPVLICGGCDKKLDLKPLVIEISKNVKEVYLIGELAPKLEKELLAIKYPENKIFRMGTLEKVIEKLEESEIGEAQEEVTVLFSPATASFDQFKNFEVRGEVFKKLVVEKFKK